MKANSFEVRENSFIELRCHQMQKYHIVEPHRGCIVYFHSPGMARVSGVQNRDERCRTMKGRVGGVLEELENK